MNQPDAAIPTIHPSIDRPGRPHDRFVPLLEAQGYRPIGRLAPRAARAIDDSPWSIGCETCDRGYVDFDQVGPHLGEIGAKAVRLQAGWARCEPRADGVYDWAWLDKIVDACVMQRVRPWLEVGYGNPAYPDGGGIGLAMGIPTGDRAITAWDAWVAALVKRYADRVDTWSIWNEPDHGPDLDAVTYADFYARTARIIRAAQPGATLMGLSLAGANAYAEAFLRRLDERGEADLLQRLVYHFYPHNPDASFDRVDGLRDLLQRYAPHAEVYQGETGAPSQTTAFLAMRQHEWSERKQAVWNLRRLLAHHARGIAMNLFQLADMHYEKRDGALHQGHNTKGQLATRPDLTVLHRKASFAMAQHVFSTIDGRYPLTALEPLHDRDNKTTGRVPWQQYAWTPHGGERPDLVSWWNASDAPTLTTYGLWRVAGLAPVPFANPVLLDWLSGTAFEPPRTGAALWRELPLSDAPFALIERESLPLQQD
ncbi:MAG: hypothetical protein AAFY08_01435 [Planctomycetota bacterium]